MWSRMIMMYYEKKWNYLSPLLATSKPTISQFELSQYLFEFWTKWRKLHERDYVNGEMFYFIPYLYEKNCRILSKVLNF